MHWIRDVRLTVLTLGLLVWGPTLGGASILHRWGSDRLLQEGEDPASSEVISVGPYVEFTGADSATFGPRGGFGSRGREGDSGLLAEAPVRTTCLGAGHRRWSLGPNRCSGWTRDGSLRSLGGQPVRHRRLADAGVQRESVARPVDDRSLAGRPQAAAGSYRSQN